MSSASSSPTPTSAPPIADHLVNLARAGRTAGITLVLVAARAHHELPMRLRDAMAQRFALRTESWQESETILGLGARRAGFDASKLPRSDKGLGILRDEGGARRIVQADFFDLACVRRLAERGRRLRIEAATLTGAAAGQGDG